MNLVGIVVTYEPDLISLRKLLKALQSQVNTIVLIDNGSIIDVQSLVSEFCNFSINFVKLHENLGIAYAQNKGIEWARDSNATHVLLMDQDSIPLPNMVSTLKDALIHATLDLNNKALVAAVGPSYVDMRSGEKSFFVIERNALPSRWTLADNHLNPTYIDATFLISSGMLIKLSVLDHIGGKRSNYFIDHVDTEWSFRAIAKGYRLLGVPAAEMHHTLGDKVKSVWFFGKRQVSYHSPLRDYYMFRNTLLMLRDVKMNLVWRLHFLWRLVQFAGYFLLFTPERRQRLYCMSLGFWHGLNGVSGKVDLQTSDCVSIPVTMLDP